MEESDKPLTAGTSLHSVDEDMSGKWNPEDFKDEFKHAVMKIVDKRVKAGDTETVIQPEEEARDEGAQVIDLTELLARSLKSGKSAKAPARSASEHKEETKQQPARKAAAKKVTPVVGSSVRMPRVLRTGLVEDTTVQTVITSSCS